MQEDLSLSERRSAILDMLAREGRVFVSELSRRFGITEVTIRNDLIELANKGELERIRGGALPVRRGYYNMSLTERSNEKADEKRRIAKAAASRVKDGETIFINAGTTTYFIAIELARFQNLKIVTNSIPIAREIANRQGQPVILLGGNVNARYDFTCGGDAISQIKRYKADKLFLSVDGIDPDFGVSTYHFEEAELDATMIERAGAVLVAADDSKIGRESFANIAPMRSVDELITNELAPRDIVDQLSALGIAVTRV